MGLLFWQRQQYCCQEVRVQARVTSCLQQLAESDLSTQPWASWGPQLAGVARLWWGGSNRMAEGLVLPVGDRLMTPLGLPQAIRPS